MYIYTLVYLSVNMYLCGMYAHIYVCPSTLFDSLPAGSKRMGCLAAQNRNWADVDYGSASNKQAVFYSYCCCYYFANDRWTNLHVDRRCMPSKGLQSTAFKCDQQRQPILPDVTALQQQSNNNNDIHNIFTDSYTLRPHTFTTSHIQLINSYSSRTPTTVTTVTTTHTAGAVN